MLSEAVADMTPLQSRHQCFLGVIQLNSHSKAPALVKPKAQLCTGFTRCARRIGVDVALRQGGH